MLKECTCCKHVNVTIFLNIILNLVILYIVVPSALVTTLPLKFVSLAFELKCHCKELGVGDIYEALRKIKKG